MSLRKLYGQPRGIGAGIPSGVVMHRAAEACTATATAASPNTPIQAANLHVETHASRCVWARTTARPGDDRAEAPDDRGKSSELGCTSAGLPECCIALCTARGRHKPRLDLTTASISTQGYTQYLDIQVMAAKSLGVPLLGGRRPIGCLHRCRASSGTLRHWESTRPSLPFVRWRPRSTRCR
jgi:hypothetical protein